MLIILLIILIVLVLIYTGMNKVNVPEGVLLFYSMEDCPHCLLMEQQLKIQEDKLSKIKVFKITLKKDGLIEYSEESEDLKKLSLSLENKVNGYPTFMYKDKVHIGSMDTDELLNLINNII